MPAEPMQEHPAAGTLTVRRVDYASPRDAQALAMLLDAYARDPAGGGEPLAPAVLEQLAGCLHRQPGAFSVIAWTADGCQGGEGAPQGHADRAANRIGSGQAVGLVNCFEGFSTFACRPLVNIHDVVVLPGWRGQRVAQQMLALVEAIARERGACKLTLEVLQGNAPALQAYAREGFAGYTLDPVMGQAVFLQKNLGV